MSDDNALLKGILAGRFLPIISFLIQIIPSLNTHRKMRLVISRGTPKLFSYKSDIGYLALKKSNKFIC